MKSLKWVWATAQRSPLERNVSFKADREAVYD